MKVKNTVLKNKNNVIVHAQTGLDQVIDKKSGIPLDVLFNETELKSRLAYDNSKSNKFFGSLEEIGVNTDNETIEEIAEKLPSRSTLIHHVSGKTGDDNIYPHGFGLLTVVKGDTANRISFKFERSGIYSVGFYDKGLANGPWSGWHDLHGVYKIIDEKGFPLRTSNITSLDEISETGLYYFSDKQQEEITDKPFNVHSPFLLNVIRANVYDTYQQVITNNNDLTLATKYYRILGTQTSSDWAVEVSMWNGNGSPENNTVGRIGSMYIDTDTGSVYIKISGYGNTGWKKIVTE